MMVAIFYALAAIALTAYVVLDGFDLGAGLVHLFVARDEDQRRAVVSAIGPYWDGNEVWLLASGGVLFAVFPRVLAVAFSGFYLALFLLVWTLMLRGLSLELRGHLVAPLWRSLCDALFAISSSLLALLFGVALGNLLRGVPTGGDGWFTLPLFTSFRPRAPVGLLDFYTVLIGIFAMVTLAHHGALFLAWKTAGELNRRARSMAKSLFPVTLALLLVVFAVTGLALNLRPAARALPFFVIAVGALVATRPLAARGHERGAFLASVGFFAGALFAVAATLFPVMLRSIDGAADLTAYDAAASSYSLASVLTWMPLALVLVAFYFANLFRIYRGKVETGSSGAH
ncbi:MAG TPA: cytochrome d ubiquinol oxidase subunit II [Polyangia bacterium]|jgi:cytochrome d ubiquinol oxidase subunit II|nr:cytochrome d ubiquinol oxidase subunit II [Polyangia bacterium]